MKKLLFSFLTLISLLLTKNIFCNQIDNLLNALPQTVYQDVLINGETIKEGVKHCQVSEKIIYELLDKYERPFTVLDIGASEGYFSIKIAGKYDCVCTMIEGDSKNQLPLVAQLNTNLNNLIVLEKQITAEELEKLCTCEHFDVVIAFNVLHHFKDKWKKAAKAILNLGDYIFIETPPSDCRVAANKDIIPLINEYLKTRPEGSIIGKTPRYGREGKHDANQKYSNIFQFSMHKNVLQKPTWDSYFNRYYGIASNFKEKFLLKPREEKMYIPWIPGINLWTFKHLNGVFPQNDLIKKEIKRLSSYHHGDFFPWNMIVQGKTIELIDWDDNKDFPSDDGYEKCISILGY